MNNENTENQNFIKLNIMTFSRVKTFLMIFLGSILSLSSLNAQFDNNGCVGGNFGIDAGLYSGIIEFGDGTPAAGTTDWFLGTSGKGVIDESQTAALNALMSGGGNPTYEARMTSGVSSIVDDQILIDALWSRDLFGGTGHYDYSSFETASKNGEDPAIWDIGQSNVLGKNDLIDVAGHMFRDGVGLTSDLWFVGLINRAAPGGSAYMDFEFFVEDVAVNAAPVAADPGEGVFTSGGPQLGHTAFTFDQTTGEISSVGDFIFNTALINGGEDAFVELRLWVSFDDYTNTTNPNFAWGPNYDGGFNGSPYGYASIVPNNDACGIVNIDNQNPNAPPWGTKGTKTNTYGTTYLDFAVVEVGINMTAFGLDHASLAGLDPCVFPINSFIVKTRASASFTAQLKDYAGPYSWAQPTAESLITGNPLLSCDNPIVQLTVSPLRTDVDYTWSTVDGNILGDPNLPTVFIDQPGTYILESLLPTDCPIPDTEISVSYDPTKPLFNEPTAITTVSCNGNDGTVDLSVTGGTPPYTYLWSNGATTEDISNLPPGDYSVVITDQIPCDITSGIFTVGAKIPTTITNVLSPVECFGDKTGAIDATITGNAPYNYSWSNGATSEDITGLSAGDYTVTATDVDGCETLETFTITQPDPIVLSAVSTDESDYTLNDGSIDLTVDSGGTAPFTYDWDNNGAEDPDTDPEDLSGLASGIYTVIVTDINGCSAEISATILEPEICFDGIDNDGDGLIDCFDPDCTVATPGTITPSNNPVCVGDTGVTYTIADTGADSYTWTVPAGATITAGQGTVQITVNWVSNIGGQICVTATIDGCESASASCFTVVLNDVPPVPGTIIIQN